MTGLPAATGRGTELWLGVDGGNSKTDVLIGDSLGRVLAFVRGPGSSPQALGVAEAFALLDRLQKAARAEAGIGAEPLARAELYLAGLDFPQEVEIAARAARQTGWALEYRLDNDTFALMRAGTEEPSAIAVVCGAGINCVGRTADGRTARFPSLGMPSGDWGGGQHLAALAMWHAARGDDGRGPATALQEAVARHCGATSVAEVIAGVHLGGIPQDRLGGLSEVLFAVAAAGDEVARRVVARQAHEIVALVTVAADRLELRSSRYAVVLGGGVLRAQHPLLDDAIREGITAHSPGALVSVLTQPPVLGAGLFALDSLGAAGGPHQTLRHLVAVFNQVKAAL